MKKKLPINQIICGDTLEVLKTFPDESVDCIITSPPYWGLRDYGVEGQMGLEPTLEEYLEKLLKITKELKRVLKKTGVCFWNHSDCYGNSARRNNRISQPKGKKGGIDFKITSVPDKCMALQNYRLILRMIDEQGWILRNIIIWHKPNHMPSSVKDRFTNAYEPVFMLVKSKKYWFDLDAVRVPHKLDFGPPKKASNSNKKWYNVNGQTKQTISSHSGYYGPNGELLVNPLGKNPGDIVEIPESLEKGAMYRFYAYQKLYGRFNNPLGKAPEDFWTIPTQPFPEAHFACADMFTEILTKNGWKKWDEVTLNDEIATFDVLDETIHYHKPYAIYKYEYKGELVVIENQWVAQYVTPNHRVLLKYIHSAVQRKHDNFWHYERADSLRPYSGILIPLSGKYEGYLDVGSVERAELLGWILTEGCLSGLEKGKGIMIYQSNDANPDKVKRIEELLRKCRIDYTRIDRKRQRTMIRGKEYVRHEVCFYIKKRGQNWQWILDWINKDKTPKWKLLHIKHEQLEALYEGIIDGDGHRRKDRRDSFTQKNEYTREWFRTLCIHLGKRTTEFDRPRLRSAGTVFVTNKNYAQIHESDFKECVKRINYKGIVWCPHLPNTNFVARRKGCDGKWRYFITGNTFPERLVEPMIKAGCPQWICKKCGKARERIIKSEKIGASINRGGHIVGGNGVTTGNVYNIPHKYAKKEFLGWTDCDCEIENKYEPGIVLDPFMGSGTTALVALKLGRRFVGIEINPEYVKMAYKRIKPYLEQKNLISFTKNKEVM